MDILQIITLVISVALVVWLLIITVLFLKLRTFFQKMTIGISKKDMKTLLETMDAKLDADHIKLTKLGERIQHNEKEEKQHIQKTALVRYNPFGETGGNQSFVLSLLDADGEGFVITSLHNRDYTRVYAKEVRVEGKLEGKNDSFSKEEREAISLASKKHGQLGDVNKK